MRPSFDSFSSEFKDNRRATVINIRLQFFSADTSTKKIQSLYKLIKKHKLPFQSEGAVKASRIGGGR